MQENLGAFLCEEPYILIGFQRLSSLACVKMQTFENTRYFYRFYKEYSVYERTREFNSTLDKIPLLKNIEEH